MKESKKSLLAALKQANDERRSNFEEANNFRNEAIDWKRKYDALEWDLKNEEKRSRELSLQVHLLSIETNTLWRVLGKKPILSEVEFYLPKVKRREIYG